MTIHYTTESDLEQKYPRLREAHQLLAEHGIMPDSHGYTMRQLAFELARRGWRWEFDPEQAKATKAYTPSQSESLTILVLGGDPVATLAIALADAIRVDKEQGLDTFRRYEADIVLLSPTGHRIALVEVQNRLGLTSDVATKLRRNLLVHGLADVTAHYFMLVSQDFGYLWDQRKPLIVDEPPDLAFSMQDIVERYLRWLEPGERLSGDSMEIIAAQWLNELAGDSAESVEVARQIFEGTTFLNDIRGARVLNVSHS